MVVLLLTVQKSRQETVTCYENNDPQVFDYKYYIKIKFVRLSSVMNTTV